MRPWAVERRTNSCGGGRGRGPCQRERERGEAGEGRGSSPGWLGRESVRSRQRGPAKGEGGACRRGVSADRGTSALTGFASSPRALMTPLTPVFSLNASPSSRVKTSPLATTGTAPFAQLVAKAMPSGLTGWPSDDWSRVRPCTVRMSAPPASALVTSSFVFLCGVTETSGISRGRRRVEGEEGGARWVVVDANLDADGKVPPEPLLCRPDEVAHEVGFAEEGTPYPFVIRPLLRAACVAWTGQSL